jgi:tRNA pseudouridine55 synthase
MDGLLIIDKPAGPTSHDVVARVRRALGERRIGHTGTLDPAATGVLPLVLGRATKLARFFSANEKSYEAVIRLGMTTDTGDAQGTASGPTYQGVMPGREEIDRTLDAFRGTFLQQPPAYSAKKIAGRRSYRLARAASRSQAAGAAPVVAPLPDPVSVTTQAIDLVAVGGDTVTVRVDCSAGFYVRALAHDLGARLGMGAHLLSLRRTRSGDATLDQAIALATVEREPAAGIRAIVPLSRMLPWLSSVTLTREAVRDAVHGRDIPNADLHTGFVRLVDPAGDLVAIAAPATASGLLHPAVVLM